MLKKDIHTYLNSLTVCIRDENMNMFIPIYHTCSPIHLYTMNSMLNVRIENTCTYLYTTEYRYMLYTTCVHIRKPAQVCIHLYLSVPLKVFICFLWFGVRIWLFSDFLHDETVDSFDGFYTPHDQAYPLGRSWKTPQSQSSLSHFSCSCIPDPDSYRSCTYSIWAMTITHFLLPYGLIPQQILLLVF